MNRTWTPELSQQWQQYYNTAPRMSIYTQGGQFQFEDMNTLPTYKDFDPIICQKQIIPNNSNFIYQNTFFMFLVFIILIFIV